MVDSVDYTFGIGRFRPKCLQKMATIQGFVLFTAVYSVFAGMFLSYAVSQITTIEKHFGMTSEQSGLLFAFNDAGFFILSAFMGLLFSRFHRPRVLAACCAAQALSNFFYLIPFFVHVGETVGTVSYGNGTEEESLCRPNDTVVDVCESSMESGSSDRLVFGLMALGMFLNGCGATGLWTVGIAYIDDNAGALDSPKYLGFLFCLRLVAPILGSLLGSGVGNIDVHLEETGGRSYQVGAWWLGYAVMGTCVTLCILPMMMFPSALKNPNQPTNCEEAVEMNTGEDGDETVQEKELELDLPEMELNAKEIWQSIVRVVTNVPFMVLCLGMTVDIAGVVAYASFLPKYIEDQFYVTTSVSNLLMGVCVPVADAIGTAFSGWLMAVVRIRLSKLLLLAVICELTVYGAMFTLMAPTCPTLEMRGIGSGSEMDMCSVGCQCDMNVYSPVCGSDDLSYYSPCLAGCTVFTNNTYENCSCLDMSSGQSASRSSGQSASIGLCYNQCGQSLFLYSAMLFLFNILSSSMAMVFMMFVLRVVEKRDKSLGQSIVNEFVAIGAIPGTTLFGRMIDNLCALHYPSTGCDDDLGACLRYDRSKFRLQFHGAAFLLRIAGGVAYFVMWIFVRNTEFAGDRERMKKKVKLCSCDFDEDMD